MYTHAEKKQIPANSGSRSGDVMSAVSSGVPNSAVLSMLGGGQGGGLPDLEQRMRERLALDNQIPDAEREADRLAASVSGARTPDEVKSQLGEKMGADFSGVRFHTDAGAVGMADNIGARAYTSGQDVYFGQGGFDPAVAAHELVHTAQQGVVESAMPTVSAPAGGVQMMPKIFQKVGGFFKNLFKSKEQKNLDKIAATNVPSRAGEQQPHLPFTPTQVQNMLTDSGGIRTDNSLKPHISPVTGAIQNEMGDYFDALENSGFDFADANKGIQKFDANATVHLRYNKGSVAATKKLLSMLSGHLDAPEMRELLGDTYKNEMQNPGKTAGIESYSDMESRFVKNILSKGLLPVSALTDQASKAGKSEDMVNFLQNLRYQTAYVEAIWGRDDLPEELQDLMTAYAPVREKILAGGREGLTYDPAAKETLRRQYAAPAAKPGFDPNSASADEQLAQSLFHYNNAVDSKSDSQINAFRGLLPRHLR